ncbi:MAG: hypothetical protein HY043_05530 [Verrucomicrobia bacterium]|nr:hypothetical protein [Verrucomicrobiota bacterium]
MPCLGCQGNSCTQIGDTSEVLFRHCASSDPQDDSLFTKGPSDALDYATSEIASDSKLVIDVTRQIPGAGIKRSWPPLIRMGAVVKAKMKNPLRDVR